MELVSLPGIIGAVVGLYIGWLDYRIVSGVLAGRLKGNEADYDDGQRSAIMRFWPVIDGMLRVGIIAGFAALGYWAGITLS